MIPLVILFFGLGAKMRISIITYAAFWPLLITTIYGVRAIDPQALDVARNFGIKGIEALWRVTLTLGLASIASGFRVSATIALVVTITTELIAGQQRDRLLYLADGTSEPPAADVCGDLPDRHPRHRPQRSSTSRSSTKSSSGPRQPGNG